MNVKRILFLWLISTTISVQASAQNDLNIGVNEFLIGSGYTEYMNTMAIPSGLPGFNINFEYKKSKYTKDYPKLTNENYLYIDYAHLKRKISYEINFPYHSAKIALGSKYLKCFNTNLPFLDFEMGLGASFDMLIGYNFPQPKRFEFMPFGNWFISPDFHFNIKYDLNKLSLKTETSFPFLYFGNYTKYQEGSIFNFNTFAKYRLMPNTFALIDKRLFLRNSITAKYNVKENKNMKLCVLVKYNFEILNSKINNSPEKKQSNYFLVGIQIHRK